MENTEDDDDLKLVKASASLLSELEQRLPKLLWRRSQPGEHSSRVHTRVRKRDLDRITQLIEPFQGEPQLLDAKLKVILPPIVDAYLNYLVLDHANSSEHLDLQSAICSLLYTLCKVRGFKIVVGFLNNEPRYLEPILEALEQTLPYAEANENQWQVPYILLLWLSHLLLTPFDLQSISAKPAPELDSYIADDALPGLPTLALRALRVGLAYLSSPTKAQESAASMLVRLAIRPDIHKCHLADHLVKSRWPDLQESTSQGSIMYHKLGSLRLIAHVTASAELSHLVPTIYRTCLEAFDYSKQTGLSSNAIAKKLVVKIFRNIATFSLHSTRAQGQLLEFIHTTDVLEDTIDHFLRALGDRDTPVRYAAAKAISLIVLELDSAMGHEVIQAMLDSFKEDMPRSAVELDFATADPLKWHGLTLALSHTLFKRSAGIEQLPDILDALASALQFQQRTATGSTLGTNVRDAANFGLWSLSRRYTTVELLPVKTAKITYSINAESEVSVIQALAIQLILSACLDPAGNIRRGSSAALQELVGRHPDQVLDGIALVQIVDYQALSLRARAMIDVASSAARLHLTYKRAMLEGLLAWRGLRSGDVPSREAAATAIARLAEFSLGRDVHALEEVTSRLLGCAHSEVEDLHGLCLAAAKILEHSLDVPFVHMQRLIRLFHDLTNTMKDVSARMLRAELPTALAKLLTQLCRWLSSQANPLSALETVELVDFEAFEGLLDRLLWRREDAICEVIPPMVIAFLQLKLALDLPCSMIGAQTLSAKVAADGSKSTLHCVGRAIALGALAGLYESNGLNSDSAKTSISTLNGLFGAFNVDWRIVGAKALYLAIERASDMPWLDARVAGIICEAVHRGLNDYTIDERGDIGSLVRLQSIDCARRIMDTPCFLAHRERMEVLEANIVRLSLEKLDRVRLKAAQCRREVLDLNVPTLDILGVSTFEYFAAASAGLDDCTSTWKQKALLQGYVSCAGVGAEPLLEASRRALAVHLGQTGNDDLQQLLIMYAEILKEMLGETVNSQPALEMLAFLLDMRIPQRLAGSTSFKWRNLLSVVQKLHHKSNDIPKIAAAVHVYIGLAEVPTIRNEVLKKLVSMLKTNPYPRIRLAVAEALWLATEDGVLRDCDWAKPVAANTAVVEELQSKHIKISPR